MRLKILLWAGLILVAGSGTIFAADFGKGDVFVQGGGYTEFGEGGGTWAVVGGGASVHLGSHVSVFGEQTELRPPDHRADRLRRACSVLGEPAFAQPGHFGPGQPI